MKLYIFCIDCIPAYNYGGYVYFNNRIGAPKEHYNKLIPNKEPDFHITSLSKFMDETLTFLPKSFFNKMIKTWIKSHIKVMAQLSKFVKWNK